MGPRGEFRVIVLDTCVVSESLKSEPDPRVMAWIEALDEAEVFLPSLVLGELRKGVELLPEGNRKAALSLWLVQLEQRFVGRILSFDAEVAGRWGSLTARMQKAGTPLPVVDSLIAAHALLAGAVLATRNGVDFAGSGVVTFNPWQPV